MIYLWILALSKGCISVRENNDIFGQQGLPKSGIPKVYRFGTIKRPASRPSIGRTAKELSRNRPTGIRNIRGSTCRCNRMGLIEKNSDW